MSEYIKIDDLDDTILRLNNDGWEITRSERKVIRNVLYEMPLYSFPEREKGEWIPVSERLPEERRSVLVWCPRYKNIYCAYLEKEQWWIFGAFIQIVPNEVVAWQPLHKPYEI